MNKELIISVLEKEPGLYKGKLCSHTLDGGRLGCFIGALLFHAGYTDAEVCKLNNALVGNIRLTCPKHKREWVKCPKSCLHSKELDNEDTMYKYIRKTSPAYKARARLKEVYGVSDQFIQEGMKLNDTCALIGRYKGEYPQSYRRDYMIQWVKEF